MKAFNKGLIYASLALCVILAGTTIGLFSYMYVYRQKAVLYQTHSVDVAPLIFLQNPFRDAAPELASENLLSRMQGKTVMESAREINEVRFNNPQGYVEQGVLIRWELSNRADSGDTTVFYYFIYRQSSGAPALNFATVTIQRSSIGVWFATEYRGLGRSNNS